MLIDLLCLDKHTLCTKNDNCSKIVRTSWPCQSRYNNCKHNIARWTTNFPLLPLSSVFYNHLKRQIIVLELTQLDWVTDCLTVAAYHSHQGFSGVRVVQSLDFCVMFCRYLFILSVIELSSPLRFTASAYAFGIFKLFLTSRGSIVVIFTIGTHLEA